MTYDIHLPPHRWPTDVSLLPEEKAKYRLFFNDIRLGFVPLSYDDASHFFACCHERFLLRMPGKEATNLRVHWRALLECLAFPCFYLHLTPQSCEFSVQLDPVTPRLFTTPELDALESAISSCWKTRPHKGSAWLDTDRVFATFLSLEQAISLVTLTRQLLQV